MRKFLKNSTAMLMVSLVLGIIFGLIMKMLPPEVYVDDIIVNGVFRLIGTGFIELIKMTVIPLVFVSLVCGISSFGDTKKLGIVGGKTILFFLLTTVFAIAMSVTFAELVKPGEGLNMQVVSASSEYMLAEAKGIVDILLDMIPSNPVMAMSEGNLLQILVFAVFFGISLGKLSKRAEPIVDFFNIVNDCIMNIVSMVMAIAPIGVFALISNTVYSVGLDSLMGVLKLSMVVIVSLFLQSTLVYGGLLKLITKLSFKTFLKRYAKIAGVAFSTSSSNATLPLSMKMMEEIGAEKSIYQFVLPVGATMNMAGTAIMQGVSAIFISQAYGINLPFQAVLTIIITALFASIGAAGVPGVGMIMMAMVLESVNLPVEGIALIIGFDRILDMIRTVVNVMGDCICTVIVSCSEGYIDREKYENIDKKLVTSK